MKKLLLITITFILSYLSIDIVDDRDYPDDGYSIYILGEKTFYLYLNENITIEKI